MPTWKEAKGWRYRFQYRGKKYNKAWFSTKADARAAEAARRLELKSQTTSGPDQSQLGLEALMVEYLEWGKRRFAVKTWKYKSFVFRSFMAWVGDIPLTQISVPIIEAYLASRHSNHNFNRHRKDLCALFAWGWKRRYLPENPCFFVETLPEPKYRRVIPTPQDMDRILLAAGKERSFILCLYHTMARLDEALRLRWEDVNFEERWIRLWTRKRKDGSWAADTLPMNQILYKTLWGLWQTRKQDEWVFFNEKTGSRFMRRPKLMKTICKRAGVRHYGFHSIRHYVASLLHDAKKISLAQVSKLLRHQNKQTTERYLQVIDPHSREAMAALESEFSANLPTVPSHRI